MNITSNLSLRDLIALTAMEVTLKAEQKVPLTPEEQEWMLSGAVLAEAPDPQAKAYDRWSGQEERLAKFCYRLADAMLSAKGNKD